MSTARERFFECRYVERRRAHTGFVRAWDAIGAAATFRDALEREGIRVHGRISVREAREHREAEVAATQ